MANDMTVPSGFDLTSLDPFYEAQEKGIEVQLRHPVHGTPVDLWITVVGMDSVRWKEARRELLDGQMRLGPHATPQQTDELVIWFVSRLILGWRGFEVGEKALEFTPDNVRMVVTKYPFVRKQIDEVVAERANFFKT